MAVILKNIAPARDLDRRSTAHTEIDHLLVGEDGPIGGTQLTCSSRGTRDPCGWRKSLRPAVVVNGDDLAVQCIRGPG